jgi:hypothetical protein
MIAAPPPQPLKARAGNRPGFCLFSGPPVLKAKPLAKMASGS